MKNKITIASFLVTMCVILNFVSAQNITGTWKRSSIMMVEGNGKQSDMYASMLKNMACATTITYSYTAEGQVITKAPDCGKMKEIVESQNGKTTWKQAGNKVTIATTAMKLPEQIYTVRVEGNTMTWIFNYAENPKTPNITKAKSMTTIYKRL